MFRILALLFLAASPVFAQEYRDYSDRPSKGEYIVLVSSESCQPCQILKSRLVRYPKSVIYLVDSDMQPVEAAEVRQGYSFVPYFIKVRVNGVVQREVLQNAAIVDDATLDMFMQAETPTTTPIADEPVGDGVLFRRFDALDKKNQDIINSLDGLSNRLTFIERFQNSFNKLEQLLEKLKDNRPILDELAAAKQERQNLLSRVNEIQATITGFKGILERLAGLSSGFETMREDLKEFKNERQGILAGLKEAREESRLFSGRLADLRKRFEEDAAESRKEREKFRPLVNLIDRLQVGVNAAVGFITQSILIMLLSILGVLLGVFVLFLIVVAILSVSFNILKKMLDKLGLSWLI